MKAAIRSIVFSFISLSLVSSLITSLQFDLPILRTLFFVSLALGFIDLFSKPMLNVMSLPAKGPLSLLFVTAINIVSLFAIDKFLGGFSVIEGTIESFGLPLFMLNSFPLSVFWGYVASAAIFTVILGFFNWLSTGKK